MLMLMSPFSVPVRHLVLLQRSAGGDQGIFYTLAAHVGIFMRFLASVVSFFAEAVYYRNWISSKRCCLK